MDDKKVKNNGIPLFFFISKNISLKSTFFVRFLLDFWQKSENYCKTKLFLKIAIDFVAIKC